ncbi:ATP-binding protein [Bartonella tamiae]|nr:ATP-binding protein [Bartonella tamiae]
MQNTYEDRRKTQRRTSLLRAVTLLFFLLFVQGAVAYGTLQLFLSLPASWTGIVEDSEIERDAHIGTVYMIEKQILEQPQTSVEDVLAQLQPHFRFTLNYLKTDHNFSEDVKDQLNIYRIAYDDENDHLYAPLAVGGYLKLGPLVSPDINDVYTSAIVILLALLSILDALLFFVVIYIAFFTLLREARSIRATANKLGEGDLTARVPKIHSEPLKMIGHVINDMASRIEISVDHNKTMLHAMAHEFRTPLARLRFGLSMLDEAKAEKKAKLYDGIEKDIEELEQLIKISLDYFRMNNKNMPTKPQIVGVKRWAEKIIDDLSVLKPQGFILTYDIANKEGFFDPELAAMAVRNIVLNAFKYARSKVHIHIDTANDALIFEFDDDGPGIAENARTEIFSPFVRLEAGKSITDNGYGVGLSFVRAIAELHHGSVFVLTSPMGGARFVMRFSL